MNSRYSLEVLERGDAVNMFNVNKEIYWTDGVLVEEISKENDIGVFEFTPTTEFPSDKLVKLLDGDGMAILKDYIGDVMAIYVVVFIDQFDKFADEMLDSGLADKVVQNW